MGEADDNTLVDTLAGGACGAAPATPALINRRQITETAWFYSMLFARRGAAKSKLVARRG